MLTSQAHCQIIAVSAIKEQKGFKKCFVTVRTKEMRDEMTNEVIRQSGTFEAEVALSQEKFYTELTTLAQGITSQTDQERPFVPCHFILRSFTYIEGKDKTEKLGKQLQLKRWWR